jgi:hypothetical protein
MSSLEGNVLQNSSLRRKSAIVESEPMGHGVLRGERCSEDGLILDRNWGTKNSHLIGAKLVFRLEGSLSCRGTSVPANR